MSNAAVDLRQERGLALAKAKGKRFRHIAGGKYLVPSAQDTKAAGYVVDVDAGACTCPDHEERRSRCKHLWAIEYFRQEVTAPDGTTVVTEALRVRTNTPRDWATYNRARGDELARVPFMLHALCSRLQDPPRKPGPGRPRLHVRDAVFCAAMKVYLESTQRDLRSYLQGCLAAGYLQSVPGLGSLCRTMEDATLTPVLERLVEVSAMPLRGVETTFAADATGFGTSGFSRWFDEKHGEGSKSRIWVKLHAMVATRSNVYTAVRVTRNEGEGTADCPNFGYLVERTQANGWNMQDVTADKAYLSHANLALVERFRATPFIPFKIDSLPTGSPAWERAYHFASLHQEEFLRRYHQRSNVEASFGATKERFGGEVKSRLLSAQFNEVLLKCLCFNLARLTLAFHELGIDACFAPPARTEPAALPLAAEAP